MIGDNIPDVSVHRQDPARPGPGAMRTIAPPLRMTTVMRSPMPQVTVRIRDVERRIQRAEERNAQSELPLFEAPFATAGADLRISVSTGLVRLTGYQGTGADLLISPSAGVAGTPAAACHRPGAGPPPRVASAS